MKTGSELHAMKLLDFTRALLREDRPNGGWVKVPELAQEVGVSRATAYRWVARLESGGWPLERDVDNGTGRRRVGQQLGVRSLLIAKRRSVDALAKVRA